MTEIEATRMATQLLETYQDRAFEISMPDAESYNLMREVLARLGRQTGPDGEFFIIKVFATGDLASDRVANGDMSMPTKESLNSSRDNSDAMNYVKSLRDVVKKKYAASYLAWIRTGRSGSAPGRGALSPTLCRAVTANLDALA